MRFLSRSLTRSRKANAFVAFSMASRSLPNVVVRNGEADIRDREIGIELDGSLLVWDGRDIAFCQASPSADAVGLQRFQRRCGRLLNRSGELLHRGQRFAQRCPQR